MKTKKPLFNALKTYASTSKGYFRIPGHRFERGVHPELLEFTGNNVFKLDVTETPLTDDLHHPDGVIAESQRIAAKAFGADETFFLVNGTTCGNQSMVMACASEGDEILIPRNAHKSVMAGLILSGARPIYSPVEYIDNIGLQAGFSASMVKNILSTHPNCKAVFAVSPTYHGFCSDIAELTKYSHNKGIPVLVDEAHGAHCYFSNLLPKTALEQGADSCSQSLHKVAGALTQSSFLHLKSSIIKRGKLNSALRLTMSTSPSYVLMTSLEMAASDMIENGTSLWADAVKLSESLRERINCISGLFCPQEEVIGQAAITAKDPTRIIVNLDGLSVSGYELKKILYDEFFIDAEMADSRNLLFIITFANTEEEADNLVSALKTLSKRYRGEKKIADKDIIMPPIPEMKLTPREAYFSESKSVS
ncbi:MAG: aminotransferase class I/II-fold pyridoxal phosphate-dependent enzyme, partial [Spirochaetales bacterium]|nr:aminotransferase class I/II-fold pyridoxal phosphate-dependent enzyme [Spirochaetales bacterium]